MNDLKRYVGYGMHNALSFDEDLRRWKDNVKRLDELLTELDTVAIDPGQLRDWLDELRCCHGALSAAGQGMVELAKLAAGASASLQGQLNHLQTRLIPSFGQALRVVLPGLAYAHDCECNDACLALGDLPSWLYRCAEDLARWGSRNAELGVTSKERRFQANRQLAATFDHTKGLLGYLEDALQDAGAPASDQAPKTISNREAARLYADLTETTFDPSRIGKLITSGTLAVEGDGHTTEGAVARYAQAVLKKRLGKAQRDGPSESEATKGWKYTCPRCGKPMPKPIGAEKVCRDCFFAFYSSMDDTTG